jgi:hypothetical protein
MKRERVDYGGLGVWLTVACKLDDLRFRLGDVLNVTPISHCLLNDEPSTVLVQTK